MFGLGQSMLGLALIAMALIHFAQRRPNTYWLWIILMFPGVGALVYLLVEAVPDIALLRGTFQVFPRRRRIKMLQVLVLDNPSVGNFEELGELLLEDKQYAKAKEAFDRVISPRTDSPDPYYRRALAAIGLGDHAAAAADLEEVVRRDPKYDYQRAAGLLADTLAKVGQRERAAQLFADVTEVSTLSETQYNYAAFLAAEGRTAEAREWAQRILNKKATMPSYMRRRERPWFWKASALQKRLSVRG